MIIATVSRAGFGDFVLGVRISLRMNSLVLDFDLSDAG
jgi:hypothetical protein